MRPTLFNIPIPWLHSWIDWIPTDVPIRGYGLMLMIGFLGATWWATRRAVRVKADPDFVVNLGFACLISSVIGARIFYVAHYWKEHFAGKGLWAIVNVTAGGLEFYGGFIAAVVAGLAYMLAKRVSIRLYLDICAPSVMFGMSMARIGCFLNGCCWGGPCTAEIPWSVRFPFASPAHQREWSERQTTIPAELMYINRPGQAFPLPEEWLKEAAQAAPPPAGGPGTTVQDIATRFKTSPSELLHVSQVPENHSRALHPVQLYSSIDGILLAILLNTYFYHRKRHGTVFPILLILYAITRFIEESIRVDNPHDSAGLTISQFVSVVMVVIGVSTLLWLRTQPLRSPRAIAFVPPGDAPAIAPQKPRSAKARRK